MHEIKVMDFLYVFPSADLHESVVAPVANPIWNSSPNERLQ